VSYGSKPTPTPINEYRNLKPTPTPNTKEIDILVQFGSARLGSVFGLSENSFQP
jgi:hypothetical protein